MYAYKNHYTNYDFFMKADDDSYVVVENLRFLLSKYNSSEPFFMGRRFHASPLLLYTLFKSTNNFT